MAAVVAPWVAKFFIFFLLLLLLPPYYLRIKKEEEEKKNEMSNKWLIYLLMASHSPAIAVARSACVVPRQLDTPTAPTQ